MKKCAPAQMPAFACPLPVAGLGCRPSLLGILIALRRDPCLHTFGLFSEVCSAFLNGRKCATSRVSGCGRPTSSRTMMR